MPQYILALDQGTTSSRAIVFDHAGQVVASAQQEFPQILPAPGIVEHDPEAIWSSQLETARQALARASLYGRRSGGGGRDQPARNDDPLGPADRPGRRPGHRLAKPRQRRDLRSPEGRGTGRDLSGQDGPGGRRLLLRHEDHALAGHATTASAAAPNGARCYSARSIRGSSGD